jgi:GTP cyclohydrolase I
MRTLSQKELLNAALDTAESIERYFSNRRKIIRAYPIPRGGVPAAYLLLRYFPGLEVVDRPEEADVFIDDLIDSGRTRDSWRTVHPDVPFFALFDKTEIDSPIKNEWLIFPWEGTPEASIADATIRLLQFIGEDPGREGLHKTPERVARAWQHWTTGYNQKPEEVLGTSFADGGENYDEMILVRDIPFYSHCEHHLAPFFGVAHIAYIPNMEWPRIVGLSKLSRLLDVYARRLQVQERLTAQVAQALVDNLNPRGVAVSIRARHLCMESRGIHKQGHETITTAVRGAFKDNPAARAEFFSSIK